MFNEIILIGKIASEPQIKETQQGTKLATIVLQVERPYRNNLGIRDSDFINCVLWRGIANQVIDVCEVGDFIGIKGRLQSKTYENAENQTITSLEVKAEHVEFMNKYLVKK